MAETRTTRPSRLREPGVPGTMRGEVARLTQERDALREREGLLRLMIDHAPAALAMLDRDMRYIAASRRWLTDFGLQDVVGRSHYEVFPELPQRWREVNQRCLAGGVEHSDEDELVRADGTTQWLRWEVRPWFEGSGVVGGLVIVAEDVTLQVLDRRNLELLRAGMDQMAALHVAAQTVMAVAHELNQPLNALSAYTEAALRLLRARNPRPERLEHALQSAAAQAQRAGDVVRELIRFVQKGHPSAEPLDLNAVVRESLRIAEADGVGAFTSKVDLTPDLRPVLADRIQVEKVLLNLVRNSVEAMRDADVAVKEIVVSVSTTPSADMAVVAVTDSGPGIDGAAAAHVFDPFFTTKAKGIGLGLGVSRALVEANGGQLWLERPAGARGATFRFTLPFAPAG